MTPESMDTRIGKGLEIPYSSFEKRFEGMDRDRFMRQSEILRSLEVPDHPGEESFIEEKITPLFLDPMKAWQPTELVGVEFGVEGHEKKLQQLQERAARLTEKTLGAVAIHAATEEALYLYGRRNNSYPEAFGDLTGADETPWAVALRKWGGEEDRHGEAMLLWMRLSGRYDMTAVERMNMLLIGNGFTMKMRYPFEFYPWTATQEQKTATAHGNTAKSAEEEGDTQLAENMRTIRGDENRHRLAYIRITNRLLDLDQSGDALIAVCDVIDGGVDMPTELIDDGITRDEHGNPNLFQRYGIFADKTGIYTARDNASDLRNIVKAVNLERRSASGEADRRRTATLKLLERREKAAEIREERRRQGKIGPADTSVFAPILLEQRRATKVIVVFDSQKTS